MVDSKSVTVSIDHDLEKADAQSTMSVFRFGGANRTAADNMSLRPPTFKQPTHIRVTLPTTLTAHGDKFLLLVSPEIHPQIQSVSADRTSSTRQCIFALGTGDRFKLYLFSGERLIAETMHGYCGSLSFTIDELTSSMGKEWKMVYRGRPKVSVHISTSGPPTLLDEHRISPLNLLFLRAHLECADDMSWWDLDTPPHLWDGFDYDNNDQVLSPVGIAEPWRAPNHDLLAYRIQCLLGEVGPPDQPAFGWGAWRGAGWGSDHKAVGMDRWGTRWAEKLGDGSVDQRLLNDVLQALDAKLPSILTDDEHRLEPYRNGGNSQNIWTSNGHAYFARPPVVETSYEQYRQISERLVLFTTVLAAVAAGLVGGIAQMKGSSNAKIYSMELWIPAVVVLVTAALVSIKGILSLLKLENEVTGEPDWTLTKTWTSSRWRVPVSYNFTRTRTYWRITQSLQERFLVLKLVYLNPALYLTGFGTFLTLCGLFVFAILSWAVDGDLRDTDNLILPSKIGPGSRCHFRVPGRNLCVALTIPLISFVLVLVSLVFIALRRRQLVKILSRRFHLERMHEQEVLRKEVILLAAHLMQWENAKDVWQNSSFAGDEEQEEMYQWYHEEEARESLDALKRAPEKVRTMLKDYPASGIMSRTRRDEARAEDTKKQKEVRERERDERERKRDELLMAEITERRENEKRREEREKDLLGAVNKLVGAAEVFGADMGSVLDRRTATVTGTGGDGQTLRGASRENFTITTSAGLDDDDLQDIESPDAESFVTSNGLV